MRFAALFLAAGFLASPAFAEDKKPSTTVKFDLEANLMWVEATMDGKGPFRLAVDTGASTTVILPDVAEELGLAGKRKPGQDDFVTVGEVKIGGLKLNKLKVAVMEIPQLTTPAEMMRMKAHGVLGYNFISRFVTTFDYRKKTITFVESDYLPDDPESGLPGLHKPAQGFLGVQVDEADVRDVKMHGYDGGLRVNSIVEFSPAEKGGIKEGDIIVDIAGTPTARPGILRDFLRRAVPGQKIVITFIRNGELWETDVVIAKVREK